MSIAAEPGVLSINLAAVRAGRVHHDGSGFVVTHSGEPVPAESMDGQALAHLLDEGLIRLGPGGIVQS